MNRRQAKKQITKKEQQRRREEAAELEVVQFLSRQYMKSLDRESRRAAVLLFAGMDLNPKNAEDCKYMYGILKTWAEEMGK